MRGKFFISAFACVLVTGCVTQVASSPYRPKNSESQWLIDGQISPTYVGAFYVNGELAAKGKMEAGEGGIVRGSYKGHPVSVTCKHTKNFWSTEENCDVFVDNELATKLHFSK